MTPPCDEFADSIRAYAIAGLTIAATAEIIGVSRKTLRLWAAREGVVFQGRAAAPSARKAPPRKPCAVCGEPKPPGRGRKFCSPACTFKAQQESLERHYRTRKEYIARYKLSRGCARCGYDESAAALDFHHVDPATKKFSLSRSFVNRDRQREEMNKCTIMCANCHRVEHAVVRRDNGPRRP